MSFVPAYYLEIDAAGCRESHRVTIDSTTLSITTDDGSLAALVSFPADLLRLSLHLHQRAGAPQEPIVALGWRTFAVVSRRIIIAGLLVGPVSCTTRYDVLVSMQTYLTDLGSQLFLLDREVALYKDADRRASC